MGSTSILTNASGVKEEDLVDYPYGETFTNTGTANVAYKYTGKELDDSTGLYFYEARYYDAALGRFISPDTIVPDPGNPQDFNRYTYANNNPILYNDPTGHFGFKSIKKGFKKVSNFLKDKLGPVGFVLAAVTIQRWDFITGTAFLTQSKEGRYVLAGEIIVATAVATYYCGGCGAAPYLQGALAGELSLGTTGGLSAARNGGDISKGVLFGTATGAIVGGISGGVLDTFKLIDPATGVFRPLTSFGSSGPFVTGTAISGGILGAGQGATEAYAGGTGNLQAIFNGASAGAIRGAIKSPFTSYASGLLFGGKGTTDYSFRWTAPDGNGLGGEVPLRINLNPFVSSLKRLKGGLDNDLTEGLTNSIGSAGLSVAGSEIFR
ncbi:MAG: RHS repeat-associated core domain-containing protein [Nitrospira sp.]|nr:RHS repeat-associated core domain-containing protein [Nitrospira sp.]